MFRKCTSDTQSFRGAFRGLALAAVLICACATSAPLKALAGPALTTEAPGDLIAGTYDVKGEGFSANPYTGQVVVEKTGSAYRVIWYPGPDQIEGVGVFWGGQFSVGYVQNGVTGVAVYVPVAGGLRGIWSEKGQTQIAPEDWTKR